MKKKIKGTKRKDTKGWNPFVGCKFDCVYCTTSYKDPVAKWGKWNDCTDCIAYRPHYHPERLHIKNIPSESVIFVEGTGDISFCIPAFVDQILVVMRSDKYKSRKGKSRVFLMQSKNPACFANILQKLPENTVLMTTIETNRDSGYSAVSKAPLPSQRFKDFLQLAWPRKAMVMEPILKFDLDIIKQWALQLKPEVIFIGRESDRKCEDLVEPSLSEIQQLHEELQKLGFETRDKANCKYRDFF